MTVPYQRCLMILADGARADVCADLLRQGKLPNMAEALPTFREATTAFPSTTGPAYMPYLTGCYPGTCNVPGIRWFDRKVYANHRLSHRKFRSYVGAETFYISRDMNPKVKTVFDLIPDSYNIFNSVSRGVRRHHNTTWFSRIWYWYYAHLTDHWLLADRAACEKTIQDLARNPEFLFVVFPGIDEHSHLSSPFHPETIRSYQELDRDVGQIVTALKQRGEWDQTAFFMVSDHGLSETQTHFELHQLLTNHGRRTLYYPKILFQWNIDASTMVSGNGMAHIYLKGKRGWNEPISWEESEQEGMIAQLLEEPAIDLIAGRLKNGSIRVKSRRGEAVITPPNPPLTLRGGLSYVTLGSDPFGYPPLPESMTDRESLDKTFATDYPDAIVQLLQIFRSPRCGDLVLSAAKGFDLRQEHEVPRHNSSHGSLHWEHMKVPVVTNVPLPERPIRSVDLFPTMLRLLNRNIPEGIDGLTLPLSSD